MFFLGWRRIGAGSPRPLAAVGVLVGVLLSPVLYAQTIRDERRSPSGRQGDAAAPVAPAVAPPARLPLLPALAEELQDPPRRAPVARDYERFVQGTIDPEQTLDLVVGRPRILVFREAPTRVYVSQENVASYDVISEREVAITGVAAGNANLVLWMPDPDKPGAKRVLSYLVRVTEDRAYKVNLEAIYAELEKEINRDFPDSAVRLSLIGDQLVVRGQAKDVVEAGQILRIVSQHAPPSRNNDRGRSPSNLTLSQTNFSPESQTTASEELENSFDRIVEAAGLAGSPNVVNLLQIPGEQQVMLRVTVAEVNRSALRAIGTNLSIRGDSGVGFDSLFAGGNPFDDATTGLLALEGGTLRVTRGDLRLTVNALKEHRLARTLAEPNLVTLHGRQARFQAGGQFPVPLARVGIGSAAQGVEFIPWGVQLQFVPHILDRDKIRLSVAANVSTRDDAQSAQVSGTNVPGLTSRNFQNTVELREGQTLAVAGLIQNNYGAESRRVPFLGDLPVLGRLFKRDGLSADEQELVILITPELVHPLDPEHCLSLPGSDISEPGDVEFFLKGYLESRRSEDFRSPVRTDWARLKRYYHCEDHFILGPNGHAYGCRDQADRIQGNWGTPTSPVSNGATIVGEGR